MTDYIISITLIVACVLVGISSYALGKYALVGDWKFPRLTLSIELLVKILLLLLIVYLVGVVGEFYYFW